MTLKVNDLKTKTILKNQKMTQGGHHRGGGEREAAAAGLEDHRQEALGKLSRPPHAHRQRLLRHLCRRQVARVLLKRLSISEKARGAYSRLNRTEE